MVSNNKISSILSKIKSAEKPSKFTHDFLKKMGFVSSNDRAVIALLKSLGFLTGDGTPTQYYDRLKDSTDHDFVLGERIRALYADLFQINTEIYKAPEQEVKGAISRITGKDETAVNRYFATFKTLASLAKFEGQSQNTSEDNQKDTETENILPNQKSLEMETGKGKINSDFHYNIQIHLPATNDVSVYNAIFKSLRDHLLI